MHSGLSNTNASTMHTKVIKKQKLIHKNLKKYRDNDNHTDTIVRNETITISYHSLKPSKLAMNQTEMIYFSCEGSRFCTVSENGGFMYHDDEGAPLISHFYIPDKRRKVSLSFFYLSS